MPRCRMTDTGGSSFVTKCVFHQPSFFVRIPGLCASNGVVERSLILWIRPEDSPVPIRLRGKDDQSGESAKLVEYRVRAKIYKGGSERAFVKGGYCPTISR